MTKSSENTVESDVQGQTIGEAMSGSSGGSAMDALLQREKDQESKGSGGGGGGSRPFTKRFHSWQDGDNDVRLVGGFLDVRTHYMDKSKSSKLALAESGAFEWENNPDKISKVVNCPNWNIDTGRFENNGCPVCELNRQAWKTLDKAEKDPSFLSDKEKAFFESLKKATSAQSALKWRLIDRKNPNITVVDGDTEVEKPGLKVGNITKSIEQGITALCKSLGRDIADIDNGVDIRVTRMLKNRKTEYSVQGVVDKETLAVVRTPLTEEERQFEAVNLRELCGKQTDPRKIFKALKPQLREMLPDDFADRFPAVEEASVGDGNGRAMPPPPMFDPVEGTDDDIPF